MVTTAVRESRNAGVESIKEQEEKGKDKEKVSLPTFIYLYCYHVLYTEH